MVIWVFDILTTCRNLGTKRILMQYFDRWGALGRRTGIRHTREGIVLFDIFDQEQV